jgi:hypothetical protein
MNDFQWRQIAMKLDEAINNNPGLLESMAQLEYTPANAWTGRNILELAGWTKFCLSSRERAKQFFEDAARDSISSLDIPAETTASGWRG